MTADIDDCEVSSGEVVATEELKCSDGRVLVFTSPPMVSQANEAIYGIVGQPIAGNDGDGVMLMTLSECREF